MIFLSALPADSICYFVAHVRGVRLVQSRMFMILDEQTFDVFSGFMVSGDRLIVEVIKRSLYNKSVKKGLEWYDIVPEKVVNRPIN